MFYFLFFRVFLFVLVRYICLRLQEYPGLSFRQMTHVDPRDGIAVTQFPARDNRWRSICSDLTSTWCHMRPGCRSHTQGPWEGGERGRGIGIVEAKGEG